MKTKTTLILSAFLLLAFTSFSQVTVDKSKSTLTGKNNILLTNIPEAMLDQFTINFYSYFFGCDANKATLCVEAELGNFDEKLALEITNETYAYFVEQWKTRGINVTCPTPAEIEANERFAKAKKKGNAEVLSPGMALRGNKYLKFFTAIPTGTAQARTEAYGNFSTGNAQYFLGDYKGNLARVRFNFDLNFVEFKTGYSVDKVSIKGKGILNSTSQGGVQKSEGMKSIIASYSNEGKGGSDFVDSIDDVNSKWIFKINREKYKALALEIIKKSIDSQLAEYDESLAKEKK